LAFQGRVQEAFKYFNESEATSPRDVDKSARLLGLATAYFADERYEEVIASTHQYIGLRPNWLGGHILLAATLGLAGRIAEADTATREILRLVPHYNLRSVRKRSMFKRADDAARLVEGLRRAGVPE
jgi:tetratricopeptide (TPR) repeat protein